MKYCKKCFRNVREDVNVCPYCGAPGLEEYGSKDSGESFTCSQPKKLEEDIENEINALSHNNSDKEDAYKQESDFNPFGMFDDETDAYGNTKSKSDCKPAELDAYGSRSHADSCDNAPDEPKYSTRSTTTKSVNTKSAFGTATTTTTTTKSVSVKSLSDRDIPKPEATSSMMRIEYLNMLKKVDGITKERIDELMKRYDETHSGTADSKGQIKSSVRTAYSPKSKNAEQINGKMSVMLIVVFIFVGFFNPFIGIILINSMRSRLKDMDADLQTTVTRVINIFTIIFVIILLFEVLGILLAFIVQ